MILGFKGTFYKLSDPPVVVCKVFNLSVGDVMFVRPLSFFSRQKHVIVPTTTTVPLLQSAIEATSTIEFTVVTRGYSLCAVH
jgi:hypothetical protein